MAEELLQGKVAMITGAGSPIGLGHAMAVGLVRAGARVALLDVNASWLEQSATEMRSIGGVDCALPIVTDITQPEAVDQAAGVYTFWDYQAGAWQKDDGIRIDHILLSPQAADRLQSAGVDRFTRAWEKPSDHVPVWVELG